MPQVATAPASTPPRAYAAWLTHPAPWTRLAGRLSAAALAGLPLVAAWREPHVAPWFTAGWMGLVLVAAFRPFTGMLILCGLGPLAGWMTGLAGAPWDGRATTELLILAVLAGGLVRPPDPNAPHPRAFRRAALLFGVTVAASCAVMLSLQELGAYWWPDFLRLLADHALRTFFVDPEFPDLHAATILIESTALAALVARLTAGRPDRGAALLRAIVIGGSAAALCSWYRLVEISLRSGHAWTAARAFVRTDRISPLYGDLNAAGSYFALLLVPALLMWIVRPRRFAWAGAALVVAGALALTSSRAAEVSAVAALITSAAFILRDRPRRIRLAVGAATLALGLLVAGWVLTRTAQASLDDAAGVRLALGRVALQMTAAHPITGVGVGEFVDESQPYITPALVRLFPPAAHGENAHDNYLQVLAELGLVGLSGFLWLIAAALWPALRARGAPESRLSRLAITGGLAAFLATCLFGHPLLTPEVAWGFFACLGLCAGLAASGPPSRSPLWARWAMGVAVCALVVSVPVRVVVARRAADRDHWAIGATNVLGTIDGVLYQRAEPHSAWFIDAHTRVVELRLRLGDDGASPCPVAMAVEGQPADAVTPSAGEWTTVRMALPDAPAGLNTRRIDLRVPEHCELLVGRIVER